MTDDFDGVEFSGLLNINTGTVHKRLDCPSVARKRRQLFKRGRFTIGQGPAKRICHTCVMPSSKMLDHAEAVNRYNLLKERYC